MCVAISMSEGMEKELSWRKVLKKYFCIFRHGNGNKGRVLSGDHKDVLAAWQQRSKGIEASYRKPAFGHVSVFNLCQQPRKEKRERNERRMEEKTSREE